jgi:hypothetical protein
MFHSGIDPMSGKRVYTATSDREKGFQKSLLLWHLPSERAKVLEALKEMGRESDMGLLLGNALPDKRVPVAKHRTALTKKAR